LLRNIEPSSQETTVSEVSASDKPQIVKLKIHTEGEREFWTDGRARKAIHYIIHVDIGGVKGTVAKALGKQPPDAHVWIVGGKAPSFVKFEGTSFEGGPIWDIDLANLRWKREARAKTKGP
jgi:hypothetical protein